MKTDSLFYNIFREFPGIFFELIGKSTIEAADYQFTSVEVKQLSFRIDGLFLPTNRDSTKPLYLVEVQFQPDERLYYRLFSELFLYLRQYEPPYPWQVVVIYPRRSIEKEQPLHFAQMLTLENITRIYLDELGEAGESSLGVGIIKLVIDKESAAVKRAKLLIAQAKEELTNEENQRNLIDLIETIIVYKLVNKSREEIEAMLGLKELKKTKVYQEALAEGEQKGEKIGIKKAQLASIQRMLKLDLSLDNIAQYLDIPQKVVKQLAQIYLAAFQEVLQKQSSLFSPKDRQELTSLISSVADNVEQIMKTIAIWLEKNIEISTKQQETINQFLQEEEKWSPSQSKVNKQSLEAAIALLHP